MTCLHFYQLLQVLEDQSEAWEANSVTPEVTIELAAEDTEDTVSADSYGQCRVFNEHEIFLFRYTANR